MPMPEIIKTDLCVIGAGAAGRATAAGAAAMRVPVVLVERAEIGAGAGVALQALAAAAAAAHAMRHGARFGISGPEPKTDFAKVREHLRAARLAMAPSVSQVRFEAMGVRVIRASARFTGPKECVAGEFRIQARRFVIAAGSRPAVPAIPGVELVRPLTLDNVFELDELPTRLVILGGGAAGLELGQAFRRLGSEVTILEAGRALAPIDPELARPVLRELALEGVFLRENVEISRIEPRGTGVRVVLSGHLEETVDGSHLLIATGRKPNVEGLELERAGIKSGPGGIKVNSGLCTANRAVFAAGSVAGWGESAGQSGGHAAVVLRRALFRQNAAVQPQRVPVAVLTDPQIATIGLSEQQAKSKHNQINVLRWPFAENEHARATLAAQGHIKVITDRKGVILGAGICGAQAAELIGPLGAGNCAGNQHP